ncbi:sigma factor-like helix-turn-helix DNA-binding protein [Streptomyces sp. NPDC046203]|uniref:sigma factor-like helix-turn-helix DNA-binding protein n=1 Tax=Streptomyces sp. NPDC046203 TaxID=3154602 RepID=UPI0033FD4748
MSTAKTTETAGTASTAGASGAPDAADKAGGAVGTEGSAGSGALARGPRLLALAHRLLGSPEEAAQAVRAVSRARPAATPATAPAELTRACLELLRARESLRPVPRDPWDRAWPESRHHHPGDTDVQDVQDDLATLDALTPSERVVFVLHDEFALPYEEIAPIIERTPVATRRLDTRARRRLEGTEKMPEPDPERQRIAVAAFRSAARGGDLAALHALLDPDVVLRSDTGAPPPAHGARAVARTLADRAKAALPASVDGLAGLVRAAPDGTPRTVFAFTVLDDRITAVDALADPAHLSRLRLTPETEPAH